jgi:hypothetical protein
MGALKGEETYKSNHQCASHFMGYLPALRAKACKSNEDKGPGNRLERDFWREVDGFLVVHPMAAMPTWINLMTLKQSPGPERTNL